MSLINIFRLSKISDLTNDSNFLTEIPKASSTVLGGIKVGANLSISSDGTLSSTGGGGGSVGVIDNLDSTSITDALSANQGRVLNKKIGDLTVLNTTNKTDVVKAINEINDKFTNISVAEGSDF